MIENEMCTLCRNVKKGMSTLFKNIKRWSICLGHNTTTVTFRYISWYTIVIGFNVKGMKRLYC